MQIMKRKNKSVQQARAAPARIVGGNDALMNRYAADSSTYRNTLAQHSYNMAGSSATYTGLNHPSIVQQSKMDKRSASINTAANASVRATEESIPDGQETRIAEPSTTLDAPHAAMNVESGIIASSKQSQGETNNTINNGNSIANQNYSVSVPRTAESAEREVNHVSKRRSHGVSGAATISDQFDMQEDSAFLAKRSIHMGSKDRDPSVTSYNPVMMRGSLNCGRRKNEMIRINEGNKVSSISLPLN